jgi:hypothetical protein
MISSKKEDDRNQRPIKEKMRAATRPAPPNRSSTGCVRTQTTQQPAESVAPSSVRTGDSPGRIGFRLLIGERAGRQRTLPRPGRGVLDCLPASRRTWRRHCSLARRCIRRGRSHQRDKDIYRCTGCGFVLYCPCWLS